MYKNKGEYKNIIKGVYMDNFALFDLTKNAFVIGIAKSVFVTVLNLLFIMPIVYLCLFIIARISHILYKNSKGSPYDFEVNYKRTIVVMVFFAIITACFMQHIGIHRRLTQRAGDKNEIYRLENIDYNIQLQDDGSANVEHIIKLHRNKLKSKMNDNMISYEFNESNYISDIHLFVNGIEIEKDASKQNGTYNVQSKKIRNKINIYLPDLKENLNLKLTYFVKDVLVRDLSGDLMYYNKFLAYRSGLSYNTNFKGSIRIFIPSDFICQFSGYSKDMYVETNKKNDNSPLISFENKPDFHQFVPQVSRQYLQGYDPVNTKGENIKDFSLTLRANFVTQGPLNTKTFPYFQEKISSLEELNNMTKSNNLKYDQKKLIWTYVTLVLLVGMLVMIALSMPFIYMYYKAKDFEYIQLLYDEGEVEV
ncbi:hypothetical protein HMPREF0379_1817 [[Eubacterium] yurii subsp. margaretiae ATCC 43715]|nr:hypothetical protein HMPREF0379_1817 [[Eubacterium] yurii subsp. margaretiae ATCC 43715]